MVSLNSELVRKLESALGVSLGGSVTDMAVVIAMTSIESIIGFLVVLWRRSSDKTSRVVKQLVVPLKEEEDEFEVASGKTRVTIFSGTQTGTAEGFAKDWWIWYGSQKQSKGSYRG
ncbi:NADPH--cytochrome P450 reductase-like isoform X2 [Rosa rugosa]|uniref:NADPH--cytochrome P450 reductase-like isoform X2 n=1 Tax=Rosa rugosa TaxID=74645 RepID=UPI002B415FDC|nr:NADPH--cytochrome P450 reductase-like isoform X2 [Rosa rugosa]